MRVFWVFRIVLDPGFFAIVVAVLGRFKGGKVDRGFSDVAKSENGRLEGRTTAGVAGGEESVEDGDEGGWGNAFKNCRFREP